MADNNANTVAASVPESRGSLPSIIKASYPDAFHIHSVTITPSAGGFAYAAELPSFGGFSDLYAKFLYVEVEKIEVLVEAFDSNASAVFALSRSTDISNVPSRAELLSCLSHGSVRWGTNGSEPSLFTLSFPEGLSKQLKPVPVHAVVPTLGVYLQAVSPQDMVLIVRIYYRFAGPIISKATISPPAK